jgi:hypothetical protein
MREGVFCKVSQCVRSATLGRSGVQTQLSQVEVIEYVAAVALDSDLGSFFYLFSVARAYRQQNPSVLYSPALVQYIVRTAP